MRKDISPSKAIKDRDATQLSERQISLTDETNATDSINAKKQNLSDVIEMCSDTAGDSNTTFDSQETISEEWTDTDFHKNSKDEIALDHLSVLQQIDSKSVMSVVKKGNGKSYAVKASSDSEEFSSPAILASYSQFKLEKSKMKTVETNTSEHSFSNKMDLKLPVQIQPVFKSILETNTLENISINQYRKFSNDTKIAHTDVSMPSMERTSTFDDATTNNSISITNNTSPSIIGSLVAEEGRTSRHLRPRHHMDNLSKYNSKNINI